MPCVNCYDLPQYTKHYEVGLKGIEILQITAEITTATNCGAHNGVRKWVM